MACYVPVKLFYIAGALLLGIGAAIGVARLNSATNVSSVPGRASGCGFPAATGSVNLTAKDGENRTRSYQIQVPSDYDPGHPYALTFVFHGAGGNAAASRSWGLQNAPGAGSQGIFVFPNGINFQHDGIGWDDRSNGYDVPFFDHMLRELASGYCIDPGQVFAAGFSWGGDFAITLACTRGDVLRAVAANSTDDEFKDTANYLTYVNLPCSSRKHPPVRYSHAEGGDQMYPAPDFATTSKLLQHLNACNGASTGIASSTSSQVCVSYDGCAARYIECSFDHDIGHTLPPKWAEDTWGFFRNTAR